MYDQILFGLFGAVTADATLRGVSCLFGFHIGYTHATQ